MPGFLDRLLGRRPTDDAAPRWTAPDDEDGDDVDPVEGEGRYLELIAGTSAKFYAAVLHATDEDTWTVRFNFGRIGHPRDWGTKVEDADEDEAREVFEALVAEKLRGGYDEKPWPPGLQGPDGFAPDPTTEVEPEAPAGPPLYMAANLGALPPATGGQVAGIDLPDGALLSPDGDASVPPVLWVSATPVERVGDLWQRLASSFAETGLWPLFMDLEVPVEGLAEVVMDIGPSEGGRAAAILGRWWRESVSGDDDGDFDREAMAPFGRRFPGLAAHTPGERPEGLQAHVRGLAGHLGLVAVRRPSDVPGAIGWLGAVNYDMHPEDQSTILRSWEDRFDAYLVGLGFDIMTVAVGRPPHTADAASAIAAEHMAFCPDNIWQGVGSIREYRKLLLDARIWTFWWD